MTILESIQEEFDLWFYRYADDIVRNIPRLQMTKAYTGDLTLEPPIKIALGGFDITVEVETYTGFTSEARMEFFMELLLGYMEAKVSNRSISESNPVMRSTVRPERSSQRELARRMGLPPNPWTNSAWNGYVSVGNGGQLNLSRQGQFDEPPTFTTTSAEGLMSGAAIAAQQNQRINDLIRVMDTGLLDTSDVQRILVTPDDGTSDEE